MHATFKGKGLLSLLRILAGILLLIFFGEQNPAMAASLQFSSETLFGIFEREDELKENRRVMPLYEYMRFDLGDMETDSLSLHMHGWVRSDAGDGDFYEEDPDGELLYGYVEYAAFENRMNLKLGRQHVFSGILNDSLDGIGVTGHLGPYLSLAACAGNPVAYQEENGSSGDGIYGGRVALHPSLSHEIGVSYKKVADDGHTVTHSAGMDTFLRLTAHWTLAGRSIWNMETSGWQEHDYETTITFFPFSIKPSYQQFRYDDYFSGAATGARPFAFLEDSDETLTVIGSEVVWQSFDRFDLGARIKQYDYDMRSETSRYTAALLNVYGSGATAGGIETGMMEGEAEENRYTLVRGYLFWDSPLSVFEPWFISSDVMYLLYQKEIYGKDHSWFVSLGTGKKLAQEAFQIELSGSYSMDPYFDSDLRMMLVLKFELGQ